jgi:hypothetical protein
MTDVAYSEIELPSEVALSVKRLMRRYGLRFAAIDMAIDLDGKWVFFEVNPNGQWAWLDLSAGLNIARSFIEVQRHPEHPRYHDILKTLGLDVETRSRLRDQVESLVPITGIHAAPLIDL